MTLKKILRNLVELDKPRSCCNVPVRNWSSSATGGELMMDMLFSSRGGVLVMISFFCDQRVCHAGPFRLFDERPLDPNAVNTVFLCLLITFSSILDFYQLISSKHFLLFVPIDYLMTLSGLKNPLNHHVNKWSVN